MNFIELKHTPGLHITFSLLITRKITQPVPSNYKLFSVALKKITPHQVIKVFSASPWNIKSEWCGHETGRGNQSSFPLLTVLHNLFVCPSKRMYRLSSYGWIAAYKLTSCVHRTHQKCGVSVLIEIHSSALTLTIKPSLMKDAVRLHFEKCRIFYKLSDFVKA